jgi:hypothetical protein
MVPSPISIVGQDGMPPANPTLAGGLFLPIPDAEDGGGGTPSLGGTPTVLSSSLDPEKQPDNDNDDAIECKLPDEWAPPPEFQSYPIWDEEAKFWHSSHARERKAVFNALSSMGRQRQLHRYVNCGGNTRVYVRGKIGDQFEFRVVAQRCHNRWCPHCARGRSTIYAANIKQWIVAKHRTVRFITLTLRHNDTPLRDQIDRICRSLLAIRRRSWWKSCVHGGVSFIEIKVGGDNRYHVHAHLIVEGTYASVKELSDEWHAVTGDSPVVDIRLVADPDVVAGYVAKYGSKPIDRAIVFQPKRLIECIQALHGRRLATTFGSWKDLKLNQMPEDDPPGTWQDCGSIREFIVSPWLEQMKLVQPDLADRLEKSWIPPPTDNS